MVKIYPLEKFREVDMEGKLMYKYAISNYGRLISYTNEFKDGRILKGGVIEGYRIFRYKTREGNRYVYKHKFFYKMVAEQFLKKKSPDHVYVLHLDYKLANDNVDNLKWATKEEMLAHQRKNPKVIKAKKALVEFNRNRNGHKLTTTKAMLLKKQLMDPNRKTRIKMLAKQFGISEMQVYRIKSGENWGHLKVK